MTPKHRSIKERLEHGAQRRIALALGVGEPTVSNVITGAYRARTERGQATLKKVQRAIARELGASVEELFPEREKSKAA